MFKFIDLCVQLSRKSHARLGLLTYKNTAQSTAVQSIENVLNRFIAQAEARLMAATEQARKDMAALPENPLVDDRLCRRSGEDRTTAYRSGAEVLLGRLRYQPRHRQRQRPSRAHLPKYCTPRLQLLQGASAEV